MHLDQGVHAEARGFAHQRGGQGVVDHRQDDQDGVGAQGAALGHLPGVDQEILADTGQGGRVAGGLQIAVGAHETGPVGQHRQAGRAAALIGPCQRRRIEVLADDPLGRRGLLDLGDQGQSSRAMAALQRGLEAAGRVGGLRGGFHLGRRPHGLSRGDLLAFVGGDLRENVGHAAFVMAISWSSAVRARPSSTTAPASSTPSRRVSTASPTRKAAAAFSSTMSR